MNFIRKINKFFKVPEVKEVDGAEVWMLTWNAYYCAYSDDKLIYKSIKAKAFLILKSAYYEQR
jgi:hypothetical protein